MYNVQGYRVLCNNAVRTVICEGWHFREYRKGNQKWTVQKNWQHMVHKKNKTKTVTTQYLLNTTIR